MRQNVGLLSRGLKEQRRIPQILLETYAEYSVDSLVYKCVNIKVINILGKAWKRKDAKENPSQATSATISKPFTFHYQNIQEWRTLTKYGVKSANQLHYTCQVNNYKHFVTVLFVFIYMLLYKICVFKIVESNWWIDIHIYYNLTLEMKNEQFPRNFTSIAIAFQLHYFSIFFFNGKDLLLSSFCRIFFVIFHTICDGYLIEMCYI